MALERRAGRATAERKALPREAITTRAYPLSLAIRDRPHIKISLKQKGKGKRQDVYESKKDERLEHGAMLERIQDAHRAIVNARHVALELVDIKLKEAFNDAFCTRPRIEKGRVVDKRFGQPFFDGNIIEREMLNILRRTMANGVLFDNRFKDSNETAFEDTYITAEALQEVMDRHAIQRQNVPGITQIANDVATDLAKDIKNQLD